MEIQDRIKERREQLNLSIRELADILGLAPSTVLRYESSAIRNMGIDKIEALANALRCSPSYLMGWEQFPNSTTCAINRAISCLDDQDLAKVLGYVEGLLDQEKYRSKKGAV